MLAFRSLTSVGIICLTCFGCARIPLVDDGSVSCTVANRVGSQTEWRQGCCQDEQIRTFIECTISKELTADLAIQIALLNNPKIQAVFEELGIAQADLIEAGLLSNPFFELDIRYPFGKGLKTNIEYLVTTSLLDIFLIPLRTKLAAAEFEQTKLKVSDAILNLAFEVRETFYELTSEENKIKYIKAAVELTSINSDIVSNQLDVGNVNTLEFQLSRSRLLEAQLELSRSQAELFRLSENLNRLLGFSEYVCLILPDSLTQEIDYHGFDLCVLETMALAERLDLQIARFEIERIGRMLGLKEWWTYTKLNGGVSGERDPDGTNVLGPGFSGELPIFNYGQAARLRLLAQLRKAQDDLASLEILIRSEVRQAHKQLMSYLSIIEDYRNRLLPMQGKISDLSEELYNVMGLGVDKLIENKRQQMVVDQNYIEITRKYLIARVDLDRALGGNLFRLLVQQECNKE